MGVSKRRRSERAGRGPMRSPGRPTAGRREHRQAFWKAIARGASSWEAAREAGVSEPVGTRWFRENGGMPPTTLTPLSGRYLSFAEREEIALLRAQKLASVRLPDTSGARRPRSLASCAGMPRRAVVASSIARRRPSGMLTARRSARRWRSWRRTTRCGGTLRRDWPVPSRPAAVSTVALMCDGTGVVMAAARIGAGPRRGVLSRLQPG